MFVFSTHRENHLELWGLNDWGKANSNDLWGMILLPELPICPVDIAASLKEYWSPKIIGELDDSYVKVAKLKGEFIWHAHDEEDELFLVLSGTLRLQFEDSQVTLTQGELFVVPKGVQHLPVAEEECCVMLIEKKSTRHTGELETERTKSVEEQLN